MRLNLIAGLGVAAAALLFASGLSSIDATGGYSGLSPRFLPTIVVAGLAVCAMLLLARRNSVPDEGVMQQAPLQGSRVARLLTLLAGLGASIALIGTLGFVTSATLLMVAVARAFGSRRLLRDGLVGLALTLPLWLIFTRLLGLSLPLLPALGV